LSVAVLCALTAGLAAPAYAAGPVTPMGTTYLVDGTTGHTWADIATGVNNSLTLTEGDVLTIGAGGAGTGSPSVATQINIDANANVTINGPGSMITNLMIYESGSDSAAHTVKISNLQITAPMGYMVYGNYRGVLNLTGTNEFDSYVKPIGGMSLGFSGSGSLTAKSTGNDVGITAGTISVQDTAQVTAIGSAGHDGIGSVWNLSIASGASLTATGTGNGSGISSTGTALSITCDGTLNASGQCGIMASVQSVSLSGGGSGVVNATATNGAGIWAGSLAVSGLHVNTNSTTTGYGISIYYSGDVTVAGNAELDMYSEGNTAFYGDGFNVATGSTVVLGNGSGSSESHPFTPTTGTPVGSTWNLANTTPSGTQLAIAGTPLSVAVAAGTTGTVTLAAPVTTYALTVNGGTGSGDYAAGTSVPITAGAAPSGKVFDKWTSSAGGTFASATAATTTFTMPASAATVTAN